MDNFIVATCQYNQSHVYTTSEVGYLMNAKSVKIDLNNDKDFEIVADEYLTDNLGFQTMVYRPGTEWGGILTKRKINTQSGEHIWTGWSARGFLSKFILSPPSGSAYLQITGEANSVIRQICAGSYSGAEAPISMVGGSTVNTGKTITLKARYQSVLEALNMALDDIGYRLDIKFISAQNDGDPTIILSAVPIVDYSEAIEVSQDANDISFTVEQAAFATRRLICLGSGELTERIVVTLYLWSDGTIHQSPERSITPSEPFSLFGETDVYDYPNAEDTDKLIEYGKKRLQEVAPYKTIKVSVSEDNDPEIGIGDIISGREIVTGELIQEPISNKTMTLQNGTEKISYVTKGAE